MAGIRSGSRLIHSVPLGTAGTGTFGGPTSSASIRCILKHVSSRLRCTVSLGFESVEGYAVTMTYAGSTWSMAAVRSNPISGKPANLHTLFSGRQLPEAYTIEDSIDEAVVTGTVVAEANNRGHWVACATWEPSSWGYTEAELTELYSRCSLNIDAATFKIAPP